MGVVKPVGVYETPCATTEAGCGIGDHVLNGFRFGKAHCQDSQNSDSREEMRFCDAFN